MKNDTTPTSARKKDISSGTDILIAFGGHEFEYDVYTLVMAFYPGKKISCVYPQEEEIPEGPGLCLSVTFHEDTVTAALSGPEMTEEKRAEAAVPLDAPREERKNILKRLVYGLLSAHTGRVLPWGDLTGIRPSKIPMKLLDAGWRNPDIAEYMRKTYLVSAKKTALAIAIANREKALLSELDMENGYALYIGIPFCPSICLYCSFGSHPYERFKAYVQPYLDALYKELDYIAKRCRGRKLTAVYIGGGTPTTLSAEELAGLLSYLRGRFDFGNVREFTVEAGRPDTITEEKLSVMKANGVSRISVNPQTMNDRTLEIIGRNHTVEDIIRAFHMARNAGFDNINTDLIVGLPGEGIAEVAHTLEQIKALAPDSLTVHSLALKRATRLHLFKEEYVPVSFENSEEIMDMTGRAAAQLGLEPYYMYRQKNMAGNLENVGYARTGCFGVYNILIMEEKMDIIAAGSGASSKFLYPDGRIERVENVKDIGNYITRIDEMIERKEKQFLCS